MVFIGVLETFGCCFSYMVVGCLAGLLVFIVGLVWCLGVL